MLLLNVKHYLLWHIFRYVYVTNVETGGQIWRLLFNRLLVSAVLFQVVMFGVLSLKSARIASFAVAPLPIVTILFKIICSRRFDHRVYYYQPKIDGYYVGEENKGGQYDKKNTKNSIGFRFGDPAFFAELPIPMVHESVRHLLPKLYGGGKTEKKPFMSRMTRQKSVRHVSVIQLQNATGGELQFQSVGEKDLELDDSTEGVKGMYKFNEDEESSNVVVPTKTNYYTGHNSNNSINPLKRLSNRLSFKSNPNHSNDLYSAKRPLVDSASVRMETEEDFSSSYYQQPHEPKMMTQDMEYFVAGQAYRTHNPQNLNSSSAIEMANIYKSQQQPYQPPPSHTMAENYNHYIRNPVGAYTGQGRAKNYHQDANYQTNQR